MISFDEMFSLSSEMARSGVTVLVCPKIDGKKDFYFAVLGKTVLSIFDEIQGSADCMRMWRDKPEESFEYIGELESYIREELGLKGWSGNNGDWTGVKNHRS